MKIQNILLIFIITIILSVTSYAWNLPPFTMTGNISMNNFAINNGSMSNISCAYNCTGFGSNVDGAYLNDSINHTNSNVSEDRFMPI